MTVIVQVSDTHFGTEVPEVVTAIKTSISILKPDIIMLSGDITQRARPSQFAAAKVFMDSLPAPTKLAIPGNHDIPLYNFFLRFAAPYRNYQKVFGSRERVWKRAGINLLCYDATHPLRHTRGKVKPEHTHQLLAQIDPDHEDYIFACAHQPLVTAWEKDKHETLIGRDETAQLWSEKQIDLAMSGHVHVPLVTTTREMFPHLPRHFILCGAGTAVSHRVRPGAPNSFNVIETDAAIQDSINITVYIFDGAGFIPNAAKKFQLTNDGWVESK